ncbi:acyl-CoA thioesterase [Shimwellia pseudoproteus]|uniref:acyl-CoA thioesterase n=1 Tax=Shimwellia pseudoproteus TaxID=570012 RepID=UPI0018EB0116|nr:thioesterase family protein [Shimwellia pseudoproteus]MBJ3814579.1 acyl-CoA thioesterase [Shimwellia pseudoproteus]
MSAITFTRPHRIRFSECDPAGIVFYPQYFVMFNDLLEQWVDALIPGGFAGYIGEQRFGLPTVHLEADFNAVSRMGDDVVLQLTVTHIGSRSVKLALRCTSLEGELRMQVNQTLVTTSLTTHRAIDIPAALLAALQASGDVP